MGWAKYYEDNLSIYVGRVALKEDAVLQEPPKKIPVQCQKIKKAVGTFPAVVEETKQISLGRRGLELRFADGIDNQIIRRLQMNGWWWCKSRACWCNQDTKGNRKYAEQYRGTSGMRLVMVAM